MVHFDAHSDTNDRYFGDNKYTHGTPFRRAVEEGLLDPKRMVQIGIRGSIYSPADMSSPRAPACASSTWKSSPSSAPER